MKLEPVTKFDKRNITTSKKIDDDVISASCDVIVVFSIYGQFEAIWKQNSRHMVCKTYILINSNLLSYRNWKENQTIFNTALILLPWVKVPFLTKNADFLQKNGDISKIKGLVVLKGIFSKTAYVLVLMYQISIF